MKVVVIVDFVRIDPYHMPTDSLKSSRPMISRPSPGYDRVLLRPDSEIYSEVSDNPQTPPNVYIETTTMPPPYEEVNYDNEATEVRN